MSAYAIPFPRHPLAGWAEALDRVVTLMATVFSNTGKAITAKRLIGASPTQTEPKWIGIGSGAGTAAITDTTLFTEYTTGTWASYARTANTGTISTGTTTDDTYNVSGTFTAGAAQTVTNAGVFDALTTGNLYLKGDFTGVPLASGDSITINASLRYS